MESTTILSVCGLVGAGLRDWDCVRATGRQRVFRHFRSPKGGPWRFSMERQLMDLIAYEMSDGLVWLLRVVYHRFCICQKDWGAQTRIIIPHKDVPDDCLCVRNATFPLILPV